MENGTRIEWRTKMRRTEEYDGFCSCRIECPQCMEPGQESSCEDLDRMREYLSARYDATSLLHEARCAYGNEYVAFNGMGDAMYSFLIGIRDRNGFMITDDDIGRISAAVLRRGEIVV